MHPIDNFEEIVRDLKQAARDEAPVAGLTHGFYRYPARFSPQFAAQVIRSFSSPGDLVLDPFAGGGTTVVEAMAHGRRAVGTDINQLATFIGMVKTQCLSQEEQVELRWWADRIVPDFRYHWDLENAELPKAATHNLKAPAVRVVRKLISVSLERLPHAWTESIGLERYANQCRARS